MPQSRLTGSRIRERRLYLGLKQAALAREVGISAAYLNLIEHNRRRIGGKLLHDLARVLSVEPAQLTEGAEDALIGSLKDAAVRSPQTEAEVDRVEELAGRFPGWTALVAAQSRRIEELELTVETLSDRLAHDPHLAASLHEVISTVTAIRSTASILSDSSDIDPEWQARFLRNMREESRRLSASAQGLVDYLDVGTEREAAPMVPQEELLAFLEQHAHFFPVLEPNGDPEGAAAVGSEDGAEAGEVGATIADLVATANHLQSAEARAMASDWLHRYAQDARALPMWMLRAVDMTRPETVIDVARRLALPLDLVLRRLAFRPAEGEGRSPIGLAVCDAAGALIARKPVAGFALPRFGAGCPLWPIYHALSRPGMPLSARVEMGGRTPRRFLCLAVATPIAMPAFNAPPLLEATMVMIAEDEVASSSGPVHPVGSTCRLCPQKGCAARRESSILSDR